MTQDSKTITLTMEQFDESLKKWKRKGTERALVFAFFASLPLTVIGAFLSDVSPVRVATACAIYYCTVIFSALMTQ